MIRRYLSTSAPRVYLRDIDPLSSFASSFASSSRPSSRPFSSSTSCPSPSDPDAPKPRRKRTKPKDPFSSPFRDLGPPPPRKRQSAAPVRLRPGLLSEKTAPPPARKRQAAPPVRLRAGLLSEKNESQTGKALDEALAMRARVAEGAERQRPQNEASRAGAAFGAAAASAAAFGASSAAAGASAGASQRSSGETSRQSPLIADVPEQWRRDGSFGAKYGDVLDTWGRGWRSVDLTHPPRAVNKLSIKPEDWAAVTALRDVQTYKGTHFSARLKPGPLPPRKGPFTDMQRMYRGKLESVLNIQAAHKAAVEADAGAASAVSAASAAGVDPPSPPVSPETREVVGLTPDPSDFASASGSPAAGETGGGEGMAGLKLPIPRAPKEPSVSLTIVANKMRVSKFAVERRRAMNRVRAAWAHVISHSPLCPISTDHCYFLQVADGKVYDAVPFEELCEEAEKAITSLARAIIAKENAAQKRGNGDRRGGKSFGVAGDRNAERRDMAKKKQIWKGTGVH